MKIAGWKTTKETKTAFINDVHPCETFCSPRLSRPADLLSKLKSTERFTYRENYKLLMGKPDRLPYSGYVVLLALARHELAAPSCRIIVQHSSTFSNPFECPAPCTAGQNAFLVVRADSKSTSLSVAARNACWRLSEARSTFLMRYGRL